MMWQEPVPAGKTIESMRDDLTAEVNNRHAKLWPPDDVIHGMAGTQRWSDTTADHLSHLSLSIHRHDPSLFCQTIAWCKSVMSAHGQPVQNLARHLQVIAEVLSDRLPPQQAAQACKYVQEALGQLPQMSTFLPSYLSPAKPQGQLAAQYLEALLAGDRAQASQLVMNAVASGVTIKDIYLHVFEPSQHEVGRLWQLNKLSVAKEHYCTAATQMIMSQLYMSIFSQPRVGRYFIGACVGGDLHEIGMRMVADFFEMEGWDTLYLGANVQAEDIRKNIGLQKPDVIGLSVGTIAQIATASQMITQLRAHPVTRSVPVLVGGRPFNLLPDLWKQIGADGCASNAQKAVDLANQLVKHSAPEAGETL